MSHMAQLSSVPPFPTRGPALPSRAEESRTDAVTPPNRPTSTHRSSLNVSKRSRPLAVGAVGAEHHGYSVVSPAAVVDLNGRYFGGRVVKACFYNLDKFRVLDLGEQV